MRTLFMASLGCAKNLVDAETILGETLGGAFALAVDPGGADIIIVNTCGFIQAARDESRRAIREYLACKRNKPDLKVIAIGCWAERASADIKAEFPGLDAVWGLDIPSSLGEMLRALLTGSAVAADPGSMPARRTPREGVRLLTTTPSFAYLRLSDGCDNRCHYCAIPLIRGGLRSREPDSILSEAKSLARQGVGELAVIGQDTTAYGMDLRRPGVTLHSLLRRLLEETEIPRLRLLYAHPAHLDDDVLRLLREEPRLCGYLDLPVQHASDSVLGRMGRGYGRDRILRILKSLAGCDFTLRTTFLVGYPGETGAEFAEALELVRTGHFRHVGAFAFSPEPGTPAHDLPNQVPPDVAAARLDELMAAQAQNAFTWLDSRTAGMEQVLIDSRVDAEWLAGRTRHEAPDADGTVYLRSRRHAPGDTVMACIKGREEYDLIAEPAGAGRPGKRGRKKR